MKIINAMNGKSRWWSAILSGVLVVLSSAPFDIWYLGYTAYLPMFIVFRGESPVNQGLAYALCCSVIATNWWHSTIIYSFMFFLLIVLILCFAFFIWGYLSAVLVRIINKPVIKVFAPAFIWIGIERILSSESVGIPCNIGISQAGQPVLIQSAALFGIYAISFLLVLSNSVLAVFFVCIKDRLLLKKQYAIPILVSIIIISANLIYGIQKTLSNNVLANPVKVSIVQPVIETNLYLNGWRDPETRSYVKNVLTKLTENALQDNPDIIAWPEGGNGYLNMRIDELRDSLYQTAKTHGVDLLISSNDLDKEGRKYNSIFSISRQGRLLGRYDKVNLVPGAEDSYTAGKGFFTIPGTYGVIGPVICYESNFPSPLRKSTANGAELLFVSTSDAAFKKTALTINHTRTAVFRAIENNRWVVHASNTGPSAIVSPTGKIVNIAEMYNRGHVTGDVEFIKVKSIFTLFGYYVPIALSMFVILFSLFHLYHIRSSLNIIRYIRVGINRHLSMDEMAVEAGLKRWFRYSLSKYVVIVSAYSIFLCLIIVSSIFTVFSKVSPSEQLSNSIQEFFTPLDTVVPDKITEKFLQVKNNTCGPAALAYMFSYYGKEILEEELVKQINVTELGTSMLELKNVVIKNNFIAMGVKETYKALMEEPLPVVAYLNDDHYVVVNKISHESVHMFDPAIGHVQVPRAIFERAWNGYLLLIRMKDIKNSSINAI